MQSFSISPTLNVQIRNDFDAQYEYGQVIGSGKYAQVRKCYCKQTRKCYAAKIIKKIRAIDRTFNLNIVENEIRALKLVNNHTSIISLKEVYQTNDRVILVLEYAKSRDLFSYLGKFGEETACHIIYQVLRAIECLHSKNILHLDIKPENVLIVTKLNRSNFSNERDDDDDENGTSGDEVVMCDGNESSDENEDFNVGTEINNNLDISGITDCIKVKLCDFSFSQMMTPRDRIYGMYGTIPYSAPELLEFNELTKATDLWAVGCLTHVLLTANTPFGDCSADKREMGKTQFNITNTQNKKFICVDEKFKYLSEESKCFVESLLIHKPAQRLSVEQALNHRWFKKFNIKAIDDAFNQYLTNSLPMTINNNNNIIDNDEENNESSTTNNSNNTTIELVKMNDNLLKNLNNSSQIINNNNNASTILVLI